MNTERRLRNSSSKSRIKFLVTDVTLYGLTGALYSLISIFSVPLLTRNLSITDYGIFEILMSFVGMAAVIGSLGQDSAFARFHYDTESKTHRETIISSGFAVQLMAAVLVVIIFMLIGAKVELLHTHYKNNAETILLITALIIPVTISLNYVRNVFKWTFRQRQYVAVSLLYSLVLIMSYYVLVHHIHMGLYGALLSTILALALSSVLSLSMFRVIHLARMDFSYMVPMLRYGVPYMLLGVMNQGLRVLDKIAVSHYQGIEAAAVYAVGFKLASILIALDSLFHMSWGPISLAIFKEENANKTYDHALTIIIGIMALFMLIIAGFSSKIISFVSPVGFSEASTVAVILSIGLSFQSVAGIASIGIDLAKKTGLLVIAWCIGTAIAIGVIFMLGQKFGMVGVALGITAGFVIESFVRILLGRMVHKTKFSGLHNVIYIPASTLLMYLINETLLLNNIKIVIKLIIIVAFTLFWLKKIKSSLK